MIKFFTKTLLLLSSTLILPNNQISAQCANNNTYYADLTTTFNGDVRSTTCAYGGEYYTATVCTGVTYLISTCGSSWDTQITLYSASGTYLDYDDDDCPSDNLSSELYWTSTFNGVIHILIDQHNCISNQSCAPLSVTQIGTCSPNNNGCPNDNVLYNINATPSGVGNTVTLTNMWAGEYVNVNVCQGASYTFASCGASYDTQLTLYSSTGTLLAHNDDGCGTQSTITWTSTLTGVVRLLLDQYTASNPCSTNSTATPVTITQNTACATSCVINSVNANNMGCSGNDQLLNFTVNYGGTCTITGVWVYTATVGWEQLTFTTPYTSGQTIGLLLALDNTAYTFRFVLSNGTESNDYNLTTGQCPQNACIVNSVSHSNQGCISNANLVNFTVNYTGACNVVSMWTNTGTGWQEILLDGTFTSGQPIGMLLNLSNTLYQYYFELSNGTLSNTYSYTSINCNAPACANLSINYTNTGCQNVDGEMVPTGNITPNFTGACTVAGIYSSVSGGPYEYLDLSAYNITSGFPIGLVFPYQGSNYVVYYVLNNGATSPTTMFDAIPCSSGETICGCDGTQLPIDALSWLGDGSLDDGSYFWQQNTNLPVDFNCAMWGFDCNDEMEEGFFGYDPYGVCDNNLPPANGCIPENCYMTSLDVLTDCYPEEVSLVVINSGGDVVIDIPAGSFINEYTLYELQMCLPPGCYTFYIYDSADDGMSHFGCDTDGQFGVFDHLNEEYYFNYNGDVYTSQFSQVFCVGPEVTCSNLQMVISNEPCMSVQGAALTPHISFDFSFTGNCTVDEMFLSASGGVFESVNVSANNWQSGDEGDLYNLLPNTSYIIYYTTSDGATSPLYAFTTGNCNNEITICDCSGTQHTIGATTWLGDGSADNGFYEWIGQPVNFNCAMWGFDCGDIAGAPAIDPYNVCNGQLPPYNGCSNTNQVLGCTDPTALNYNPLATINNGSCIYNAQLGCTNPGACNYNSTATADNGTCEFVSCAGCTDEDANNYDPSATIDDGSCDFTAISGCTNPDALNYNPLATVNDGSCVFTCLWPSVAYDSYCTPNDQNNFYIDIDLNTLGNGAPYTITNSYNNQQQVMSLIGSVTMGPFPIGVQVVALVTSNTLNCAPLSSAPLTENCAVPIPGCTDPQAINYNPAANVDNGTCEYESRVDNLSAIANIHLYPNPAKDQITLMNKGLESLFQIIVLDNMGKQVSTQQAVIQTHGTHQMDISNLAQGHYHIQIVSNGKVEHRSLIIQK